MLVEGEPIAVAARVTGNVKRWGHVTNRSVYSYQGVDYPINTTPASGCYTKPLSQMIRRIVGAVEKYKRVLFIRFDLSMGDYEPTSERLSAFLKLAARYVRREYQTRLGYVWCREQEKAKRQHYHLALFIDGDKLRHPARLYEALAEIWQRTGGRLSIPENGYLMTERHNLAEVIYRVSYLAKERGKGYRPPGSRDFGWSRLP